MDKAIRLVKSSKLQTSFGVFTCGWLNTSNNLLRIPRQRLHNNILYTLRQLESPIAMASIASATSWSMALSLLLACSVLGAWGWTRRQRHGFVSTVVTLGLHERFSKNAGLIVVDRRKPWYMLGANVSALGSMTSNYVDIERFVFFFSDGIRSETLFLPKHVLSLSTFLRERHLFIASKRTIAKELPLHMFPGFRAFVQWAVTGTFPEAHGPGDDIETAIPVVLHALAFSVMYSVADLRELCILHLAIVTKAPLFAGLVRQFQWLVGPRNPSTELSRCCPSKLELRTMEKTLSLVTENYSLSRKQQAQAFDELHDVLKAFLA
ncbi:hypothetical protein HBI70_165610 [Parastagonospora nodorum]|nr:hypothetical protein HBH95_142830 [Parastagonospora nodorum]KAH5260585.1 hypothetical protein HBI70_165610 [Parastagonospora nodorum]